MTLITLKLTLEETGVNDYSGFGSAISQSLSTLKCRATKSNSEEMKVGKALVARMKLLVDPESAKKIPLPAITM